MTLSTTFTVTSVPTELCFAIDFLTSEHDQSATYDDLFDVTLNLAPARRGSVQKNVTGNSPWPDYGPYDGVQYTVTAAGPLQNTFIRGGRTGWRRVCVGLEQAGSYTLQFRVADQGDRIVDSALLVDAVAAPAPGAPTTNQLTATTGAFLEAKPGSLEYTPVTNGQGAFSQAGDLYVFTSSANLTGDNPNAKEQVFAYDGLAFQRLTSATSGSFSRPSVTANGRWVAFASTADLTGTNPDGNWEIFRLDRLTLAVTQITNTTGCTNKSPVIAGDTSGNVVAFVTSCSLPAFANPDGNDELVVWNGAAFAGSNTSGCQNYAPSLARGTGTTVAFVSTCNIGGSNADGNPEIYLYQTASSTFQAITNTTIAEANDTPSISGNGTKVLFTSNGNFAGGNADGSYEVFLWVSPSTILQLSNDTTNAAYTFSHLTDAGVWALGERLDLVNFTFEARSFNTTLGFQPGTVLFSGPDSLLPVGGISTNQLRMGVQSTGNPLGGNADGNPELFHVSWPTTFSGAADFLLACAQPASPIPDNNATGVTSTVTFPAVGTLADVNVWVSITHTRVSDLQVELTSPAGPARMLVDQPGLPGGGCNGDNVDAVLDDAATQAAETQCLNLPALSGYLTPNNSLGIFNGQVSQGNWQLRVADRAGGQTGTLQRWCLMIRLN